ncbi:hypothetical protein [Limnoglobus roseus]|uniref:Tetratricopeptide repeat protein n=1 Tax=Limnoglobus roseus TaxID=2598579 RepID=A0A5C1ATM1_9BACT|nr:hypothetical protein [Limnoglobus roseus]QEL20952.1 hypothetical protein PX52LOC_08080 [Limnoglobus roseus]
MSRLLVVTALALLVTRPAIADTPNPFDLVQGLREHGMSDLAMEYLDELAKNNPTADQKVVIPLEKAKTNLLLAQQETDESVRDAAIALAKTEFGLFLLDHAKHPRAPEAAMALARVLSLQAKTALNRAARIDVPVGADGQPDDGKAKAKKAAYAAVRPLFKEATDRYGQAAKQIKAIVDNPMTDAFRRKGLARDAMQAELDRGINQYNLADTYIQAEGQDLLDQAKALQDARKIFADLGQQDVNNPICWAARAWVGACYYEMQDMGKAKEAFAAVRSDALRNPTAGADGVRMVEFFEAQREYVSGRGGDLPAVRTARVKTKGWLDKDKYKARMTPERLSMTYYHAILTQREAEGDLGNVYEKKDAKGKPSGKLVSVTASARALLQEAARDYKKLLEFDNDYTDRASRQRMRAIRFIVGNARKPAAQYTNFDECLMAAQVRLGGLDEAIDAIEDEPAADDKKPGDKKADKPAPKSDLTPEQQKEKAMTDVIALFERARDLITPETPAKDAAEAKLWLAVAYRRCGFPQAGAVAAENVALTTRGSIAAKAGLWAIECYRESRAKIEAADVEARTVDRNRAIDLGLAIDKAQGTDPATDGVRTRLGELYLEEKQFKAAFDILNKVNAGFAGAAGARTMQGRAAFYLFQSKDSPLSPEERTNLLTRARTAAEAVPEPANPDNLRAFFIMRNVLAQLYLIQGGGQLAKAESIATGNVTRVAAAPMPAGDKKTAKFSAEEVRLRAQYAQLLPLYKDAKYKELADRAQKTLLDMKQAGPAATEVEAYRGKQPEKGDGDTGSAVVAADSLDKYRRDFIVLALQARIREGAFDQAAELFKLLEQLGGSVEATTEALARLVTQVRPQIDELKKQMKDEEAKKLMDTVGKLLTDQAAKDKLAARPRAFLGRALRDLGLHDKAHEVLAKVPSVDEATLRQPISELDAEKRDAVIAYQIGQIESARVYRLSKQFDKADEILTAALGADGKSGWAKSLEFRKERVYVIEDRATDAPADKKRDLWVKATQAWAEVIRPYLAFVTAPIKKTDDVAKVRQDRERIYPVILDLFVEEKRCFAKANMQLIAAPAKQTDALTKLGKDIARLEKGYEKGLNTEIRQRFATLLDEYPAMKDGYKKDGGTAFLDPTADLPEPATAPATPEKK